MKTQRRVDWRIYCLSPNPWQKPKRFALSNTGPKEPKSEPVGEKQVETDIDEDRRFFISNGEHRTLVKHKHKHKP